MTALRLHLCRVETLHTLKISGYTCCALTGQKQSTTRWILPTACQTIRKNEELLNETNHLLKHMALPSLQHTKTAKYMVGPTFCSPTFSLDTSKITFSESKKHQTWDQWWSEVIFFPKKNLNFSKTHIVKIILSFSQCRYETQCVLRRGNYKITKWKNTKINCKTTGRVPSRIWPFPNVKTMLCIPWKLQVHSMLMYQWWLFSWLTVCYNLSEVEIKLTEMQKNLSQKKL